MAYTKTQVPGIFKRPRRDGGDTYSVAYRDPITKKTVFKTAGSSFADAKTLKRQLEDQRERGISTQTTKLTVPELWRSFTEDHLSQLAPSTQADYLSAYSRYIEPRYRRAQVISISRAEALAFRTHLGRVKSAQGKPLSAKRIRNVITVFQALLSYAQTAGHIDTNPVSAAKLGSRAPKSPGRDYALTTEETKELLRAIRAENPRFAVLFSTLSGTGMRLSECLALSVEDVDLAKRRIRITKSIYRGMVKSTKTGESRVVGIGDALAEELEEHLVGRSGLLFQSRSDGYIDPNGLRRHCWDKALAKSNLRDELKENLHIHDLRHSWVSRLVNGTPGSDGSAGSPPMPLPAVMKLSGHHSVASLMIYAHTAEDDAIDRSVDILNAAS
jgi:integrase